MTRNLLRLAVLAVALATTFAFGAPEPAAAVSCGSGAYFVNCSKKCCGPGVTTTYNRTGLGASCSAARSACSSCLPGCPAGQSLCGGPTFGLCGF